MSLPSNAMQITLSTEQSHVLEVLSQQGGYASMADALDMALVLLAEVVTEQSVEDEPKYWAWAEQTRLKIEAGIEAADRGEVLNADTILAKLRQKVEDVGLAKAIMQGEETEFVDESAIRAITSQGKHLNPNFSPARFEGGPPHLVRPEQWVEGRDCRWQGKFLGSIGPEAFS